MASSSGDRPSGSSAASAASRRSPSIKQSFWSHQLTEYVLGAVVLTQGIGGGVRVVPIVAGVLVVLLAATADGPIAVVKILPRPLHRIADIAGAVLLVVLSIVLRDDGTFDMAVGLACAAALMFLVVRTDYRPPKRRGLFGRSSRSSNGSPDDTPDASNGASGSASGNASDTASNRASARSEQIGRTAGRLAGRAARAAVDRTKGNKDARD